MSYTGSSEVPIPIERLGSHYLFTENCQAIYALRRNWRVRHFPLLKGMIMNSNNKSGSRSGNQGGTHEQHVEAGRQSHKNDGNQQSASSGSGSGSGMRGGSREQHAEAGRQSHKNDGNKQSGSSGSSGSGSGGTRGGTPEQHAEAGRQSHKNDNKR
jgi:hypothetical protein